MTKKLTIWNTLAIMSIYLVAMSSGIVGSSVQPMIESFPEISPATIRLTTTIPSVTAMIMMIAAGSVTGKYISFRRICLIGAVLMLVGGVSPFLMTDSVYAILAFRLLLGVGVGCFGVRNALIIKCYPPEKRASLLGYGMFAAQGASIILSTLAGILAAKSWNLAYLTYSICAVTVVLTALFLPEPPEDKSAGDDTIKRISFRFPWKIWMMAVLQMTVSMCSYPILIGMSTYLVERQLGGAALAGTVISVFSLGGVAVSLIFGRLYKILGKWNIPVFILIMLAGNLLIINGNTMAAIYVGAAAIGGGFTAVLSAFLAYTGQMAGPSVVTSGTTIIMALSQMGILLSSYFISFSGMIMPSFGSEVKSSFFVGIVLYSLMILLSILCRLYPHSEKV